MLCASLAPHMIRVTNEQEERNLGEIIQVNDLTKTFQKKVALNHLSFEVNKGEIFGFLGPSGSGKTTTIKILTGQLHQSNGTVRVFEKSAFQLKEEDYSKIGILTDNSGLYERLSIEQNLKLYCQLYKKDVKRIHKVLQDVNLLTHKKDRVKNLSKGMKQRVLLARAIIHEPELLFLDEPTSALDPVNTKNIHECLRELKEKGTTIFLTTHDMQEADGLCDRIAFIHDGKISELDTPNQLKQKYGTDRIIVHLTNDKQETILKDEAGAVKILNWIKNGSLVSIHSDEPTIGDIFVELTGRKLV